jgi:hypothetical protein
VKVLLDSNVPHDLRAHLSHHESFTAAYMGWSALKNGELLNACEGAGFDVLVTGDKTLPHEQNLTDRKIALVCISAVSWPVIEPFVEIIVAAVDQAVAGRLARIECGIFSRRRTSKPEGPTPSS